MIAGATEAEEDSADAEAQDPAEDVKRIFEAGNIKDAEALRRRLLDAANPLSKFILDKTSGLREVLDASNASESELQEAMLNALDEAARSDELPETSARGTSQEPRRRKKTASADEIRERNKKYLIKALSKELQNKPPRDTEKRTAPVRMHALVAFSGIKTARDFQTFSRDTAFTGANSVLNPNKPGIYSAWLKTRILIESHRIGKFYVGKNMDILPHKVNGMEIQKEQNPYSRDQPSVEYVDLGSTERTRRLQAILRALANIGNTQGPASGALHDGSLRPKAFVAGMMKCADSPFDYIWAGHNDDGMPYLDVNILRDSIKDWEDLFAQKRYMSDYRLMRGAAPRSRQRRELHLQQPPRLQKFKNSS